MFRRSVSGKPIFYNEFYVKAQDRDLIYRLSEQGEIAIFPENLYLWRLSRQGISANCNSFFGSRATENYLRRMKGQPENYSPPTDEQNEPRISEGHFQLATGLRYLAGYRTAAARKCFYKASKSFSTFETKFIKCLKLYLVTFLPKPLLRRLRDGYFF
jgi:hypothetical protein